MEYVVEKIDGFKLVGFQREFAFDTAYQKIPEFWEEFSQKYWTPLLEKDKPEDEIEEIICSCRVGEFGAVIADQGAAGSFRYLIGGLYKAGAVPEGMTLQTFPDMLWAKFTCRGPLPRALQATNTRIFSEWLPSNGRYEMAVDANIEWYSPGDASDPNYESGIWIPVNKII